MHSRAPQQAPSAPPMSAPPSAPPRNPAPGPKRRRSARSSGLLDPVQLVKCFPEAVRKLHPRALVRNPVLFVVGVGSVLTTLSALFDPSVFTWVISVWLWLTVIFANLAEAVAEGRGRPRQSRCARRARTRWRCG